VADRLIRKNNLRFPQCPIRAWAQAVNAMNRPGFAGGSLVMFRFKLIRAWWKALDHRSQRPLWWHRFKRLLARLSRSSAGASRLTDPSLSKIPEQVTCSPTYS
jgi:hypothetical protein